MIILTTEQLYKMAQLDREVRTNSVYLFPENYEYLRPYFETAQYEDYIAIGFNFMSPKYKDLNFGYGNLWVDTKFTLLNKMSQFCGWFPHWIRTHFWAVQNAYLLAMYYTDIDIPDIDTLEEAFFEDYRAYDRTLTDVIGYGDDEDYGCACGGAGACIECNPSMFIDGVIY